MNNTTETQAPRFNPLANFDPSRFEITQPEPEPQSNDADSQVSTIDNCQPETEPVAAPEPEPELPEPDIELAEALPAFLDRCAGGLGVVKKAALIEYARAVVNEREPAAWFYTDLTPSAQRDIKRRVKIAVENARHHIAYCKEVEAHKATSKQAAAAIMTPCMKSLQSEYGQLAEAHPECVTRLKQAWNWTVHEYRQRIADSYREPITDEYARFWMSTRIKAAQMAVGI